MPRPSWPVAYTKTPRPSAAITRSAARSWTPQSQRSEPSTSPVRHSECTRVRTACPSPTAPLTSATCTEPDGHENARTSNSPSGVGRGTRTSSRATPGSARTTLPRGARCASPSLSWTPFRSAPVRGPHEPNRDGRSPVTARVLRFVGPGRVELGEVAVREPADGELLVRAELSGISAGTEMLAYRGELDPELALDETLEALDGTFAYPFAYGYSVVGRVERSHASIPEGARVFAFHAHQDLFVVGERDVIPL